MLRCVRTISGSWYIYDTRRGLNLLLSSSSDAPEFPVLVQVQVTLRCTRACPWCYVSRTGEAVDVEKLARALHRLARHGTLQVALTGGEPLLHPDLRKIVRTVKDLDLSLTCSTNGDLVPLWLDVLKEFDQVRLSVYNLERTVELAELLRREGIRTSLNFLLHSLKPRDITRVLRVLAEVHWVRDPLLTVVWHGTAESTLRHYSREDVQRLAWLVEKLVDVGYQPLLTCHTLWLMRHYGVTPRVRLTPQPPDGCGGATWMICLTPRLTAKACSFCRAELPLDRLLQGERPARDCGLA